MVLVLDIGNTHTRSGCWDNGVFSDWRQIPSAELSPEFLGQHTEILAASVNPAAAAKLDGIPVRFLSAQTCSRILDFSLADSRTIGADRLANAVALTLFFPLPALVVDCGTAITVEAVDEKHRFLGGAIAPGRLLMRKALAAGTALLPELPRREMPPVQLGCDTASALALGIDRGAVGMVRELLNTACRQYPFRTLAVAGGDAAFFADALPGLQKVPEFFTMHGIRAALEL